MAQLEDAAIWLTQAEADLRAARAEHGDVAECHRRYWLQQSYEKAIKAYALIHWKGPANDKQFRTQFLLKHSPFKSVGAGASPLSLLLHKLMRQLETFVRRLDNAGLLLKIDDTETSSKPDQVSYRYPFFEGGNLVAPCEYEGWEGYLSNREGATAAVDRLLRAVGKELKVAKRGPR
jgi:hypothetical protein